MDLKRAEALTDLLACSIVLVADNALSQTSNSWHGTEQNVIQSSPCYNEHLIPAGEPHHD